MNRSIKISRGLLALAITIALLGALIALMCTSFLIKNETVNLAVSIDLLLTVPVVYFLLIRKTDIPKTTVIPVMVVGFLVGAYFLPQENQTYLNLFKTWALPVIEISVLTYVVLKVRSALKSYRSLKNSSPDFFATLKKTCAEILPSKLVIPFATEVAVIYYGFFHWKSIQLRENEFSHHKKSGTPALFGAFILMIVAETIGLHFLLAQWSQTAAWILTILSAYTGLQVFGFAKSLSKRPIAIHENELSLRYGILNEVEIPFSQIIKVELSRKPLNKKDELIRTLSPLGELESHNVIIHLKKVNELRGLYGMKKKFRVIGMHLDDPIEFNEKLNHAIQNSK